MAKKVLSSGLMGGVVLVAWMFVVNGIFGLKAGIDMKRIPGERQVHEILKEHIPAPGRYICNPALTVEGRFPEEEPVFSVLHGGTGHGSAGAFALFGLVLFLAAPTVAAWMLSQVSDRTLSSYPRKVLFFGAIGLLIAVFSDLTAAGIGGYPAGDAVILGMSDIAAWTLVGLAVAWRMQPGRAAPASAKAA